MAEPGGRIEGGAGFELDKGGVQKDAREGGLYRGGPEDRGGPVGDLGDDGGKSSHRLGAHEVFGDGAQVLEEAADVVGSDFDVLFEEAGDEIAYAGHQFVRVVGPALEVLRPVSEVVLVFAGVESGCTGECGVVGDADALSLGPCVNLAGALGPGLHELLGHAGDAGELVVGAVLLHADAEALLKVPGQRGAVPGAEGLGPHEGRVLVVGSVLAVVTGVRDVEADDVRVQLGVLLAVFAMLEHRGDQFGGDDFQVAVAAGPSRVCAFSEHPGFVGFTRGVVVRALNFLAEVGVRDGPERGDGLVRGKGDVYGGGSGFAPGVARQLGSVDWREAPE